MKRRPPLSDWQRATLALLAYALAALVSAALAIQPGKIIPLWFANAIGAVALLALPLRLWLPMLLALGIVSAGAHLAAAADWPLAHGPAWREAAALVPGHLVEMLLATALLRRMRVGADTLRQPAGLGQVLLAGGVLPVFASAFLGAALSNSNPQPYAWGWTQWFAGHLIGTVAMLPLALALQLHGRRAWGRTLRQARTQGLLLLCLAITLLATTTLSQPFVVVAIALVLVAVQTSFAVTTLATLGAALLMGLLLAGGILLPPPSSSWWSDLLYFSSFLASLLPGLFLSSAMEGETQAMRQLLASEQRFRSLYTRTPAMMHSIDPQGRIIQVSDLWLQTLGYREDEVLGRPSADFLTPESARRAREVVIPQALRDGRCDNVEYQMRTRDGRVLDVLLSAIWIYDRDGLPQHSLAVVQDVTEKKHLLARSHYAEHDPLTGLPNRVLLQDRLERSCAQHQRHGTRFAVGFLDLDHFKDINDSHGHEGGDWLLQEVARRLQRSLRASDTVCRLAGDEFVLLFDDVAPDGGLEALAHKVLEQVAQPCRLGPEPQAPLVDVAASMGVAIFPEHGQDPHALMAHADQAMYAAKRAGRNRIAFYRHR